jgi:acetyltransferase-like isoleucine patch superfamily enzyme
VLQQGVKLAANAPQAKVTLGDRVQLDRGVDVRVVSGYADCHIAFGDNVYVGPYCCFAGPGDIAVGNNCMIGSHSSVYANNHAFAAPELPIKDQGLVRKGVVIEDDCWLGTGVRVLDGVRIGRGSVVGAGAVVTRDLAPYSVAMGVPARRVAGRG